MSDFVFAEKPSGLNSHQSHPGRLGFVEYMEKKMGQRFFLVSRLDQGTSGVMVLPTSAEAAEKLTKLFEEKKVSKTYYFLTDEKCFFDNIVAKSFIEKHKNEFISNPDHEPNSETKFKFIRQVGPYYLWQAKPLTGKTHQIRLHARDHGIPVLGDKEHGGKDFYRLCLHCQKLEFDWDNKPVSFSAKEPVWFEEASVSQWILQEAQVKRELLLENSILDKGCYRLVHRESSKFSLDIFGAQAWAYRYDSSELSDTEKKYWHWAQEYLKKPLLVKAMANRGKDPQAGKTWKFGDFHESWHAKENGIDFEFRSSTGQSPGLFLDQRENRQWLSEKASGKKILNLFAYTGGFSVVAAKAEAKEVVSVDASRSFLNWAKKNFELNKLDPAQYEFWESDVMLFLKGAIKKARKWDIVVCDPPSFGRSKEGAFKIDKDLSKLLDLCTQVLSPKGRILFSTNYEKWTSSELTKILSHISSLKNWEINPAPGPGFDFELSEDPILKSFILKP